MVNVDRRDFIALLGGSAAVASMSAEAKANALEGKPGCTQVAHGGES
jgi:hypothetical protein